MKTIFDETVLMSPGSTLTVVQGVPRGKWAPADVLFEKIYTKQAKVRIHLEDDTDDRT